MTIVSDPRNRVLARQEIVALALINVRQGRGGKRTVALIEEVGPELRADAMFEADAVLKALRKAGCEV